MSSNSRSSSSSTLDKTENFSSTPKTNVMSTSSYAPLSDPPNLASWNSITTKSAPRGSASSFNMKNSTLQMSFLGAFQVLPTWRGGRREIVLIWVSFWPLCSSEWAMMLTVSTVSHLSKSPAKMKHWWNVIFCQAWDNLMKTKMSRKSSIWMKSYSQKESLTLPSTRRWSRTKRKPRNNWQLRPWLLMTMNLMN